MSYIFIYIWVTFNLNNNNSVVQWAHQTFNLLELGWQIQNGVANIPHAAYIIVSSQTLLTIMLLLLTVMLEVILLLAVTLLSVFCCSVYRACEGAYVFQLCSVATKGPKSIVYHHQQSEPLTAKLINIFHIYHIEFSPYYVNVATETITHLTREHFSNLLLFRFSEPVLMLASIYSS